MAKKAVTEHPGRHEAFHLPIPPDAEKPQAIEEAEKVLSATIIQLLVRHPFFGQLLCSMRQVPTWALPTMGVDGVSLFYNPAFLNSLSQAHRRGVLCHEIMHLALRHIHRKRTRTHKLWNAACDYAVNVIIKDQLEMTLPEWVLYRSEFTEKSAEEIYRTLLDERSNGGGKGPKGQKGTQPGGNTPGDGNQGPDCPFCQEDGDDELNSFDSHMSNPDMDEDALTDRIVRAAEMAKRRGSLPAGIERLVDNLRKPVVDWKTLVRGRALDIFQKVDYHPQIRSLLTGSVMGGNTWIPGLAKEEASLLVLVVDTSGSISHEILNAFASEIKELITMADRTIVMSCDAELHEVVEIGKFDHIFDAIKFKGGGGTDFRPPFTKVAKEDLNPNLMVYFTDGYGSFPDKSPDFPVLWAFTKQHSPAPWGESVVVTEDEKF